MKELTDLEICKRIAEINGLEISEFNGSIVETPKVKVTMNRYYHELNNEVKSAYHKMKQYNPLTDDALCFQLMVKYKVDIEHFKCGTVSTYIADSVHGEVIEINVNKAICLAIIEANK